MEVQQPKRGMNKQWVLVKRPTVGKEITEDSYKLVESPIPSPQDGEILIKMLFISVDPYMRIQQWASHTWEEPHPLNAVQGAATVGEVLESRDSTNSIKNGDIVCSYSGWQQYAVCKANAVTNITDWKFPYEYALGVLGMPARTAYFGMLEAGKPKAGETVVVSAAAGAVGSIAVQIAKILGCRAVAIASSDEKLRYLKEELHVDSVVNYKTLNGEKTLEDALRKACPSGIDVYFDNTGGVITDAVISLINVHARIVICGQISQYGSLDKPELGPRFLHQIFYKRATIQGVLERDFIARGSEMHKQMTQWLDEGKIKFKETLVEGFEKLPQALQSLFVGANIGKLVVKV